MSYDYKVNGKEYSVMSAVNCHILSELVDREIYCCMTQEINFIIKQVLNGYDDDAPFDVTDYDDALENGESKVCEECGSAEDFEDYDPTEADESDFHGEDWNPDKPIYICPICGCEYETLQEARECCQHEDAKRCPHCGKVYGEYDYEELDHTQPEIYEWYAVSDWLGDKLGQHGEVVISTWGKSYWGRQSSGQRIILDSVIQQIAYDMGILEGQANSWEDITA